MSEPVTDGKAASPTAGPPTARERRRVIAGVSLRALASATMLVALYYLLPLDRALDALTVVVLAGGLLLLMGGVAWRVRAITHSDHPRLRAIEMLAGFIPFYVLIFAVAYYLGAQTHSAYFSQPLDRTDALYFSVTVLSTVGFGDITPRGDAARLMVSAQMLFDLVLIGLGARVVLGAVRLGQQRHGPDAMTENARAYASANDC